MNPPRGMRDFLPAEKARRERVLAVIRERYRAHGFDEIETPVMEDYARLHAGIGGDNEKLAYNVLKRGLDADAIRAAADDPAELTDLGLRYDLTVPLARFYASHRGELPAVFRAIQIAPVWRAERPQKGRYRQFMQCDIDIMGDASPRAEAELIVATLDAVDALGLDGSSVRINDRRALDWMLESFGFGADERPGVLITIDKLDKVGPAGVVAELRDRGATPAAVDALRGVPGAPADAGVHPFGERQIRKALPEGAPDDVVAHLVGIGEAVAASRPASMEPGGLPLVFDPFLVRGMGYYTGTIFELAHPSVDYSLGGGGRYDGMIGRFLGQEVPAVGFSLGFERLVDLIADSADGDERAVVLVHDRDVPLGELLALKAALTGDGVAGAPGAATQEPQGAARAGGIRWVYVLRDGLGRVDGRRARTQAPHLAPAPIPARLHPQVETAGEPRSLDAPVQSRRSSAGRAVVDAPVRAGLAGVMDEPTPDTWRRVDAYLTETLVGHDAALETRGRRAVRRRAAADRGGAGRRASCCTCSRASRARGACSRSARSAPTRRSGWRAASRTTAVVVTIEAEPRNAEIARANLERAGVGRKVEIRLGRGADVLPTLEGAEPFDLVFIDADKESNTIYLDWAARLGRPGTVVVVDNIGRGGEVANPATMNPQVIGTQRGLELLGPRSAVRRDGAADARPQGLGRRRDRARRVSAAPAMPGRRLLWRRHPRH